VSRRQGRRWAEQDQAEAQDDAAAYAEPEDEPEGADSSSMDDKLAQLQRLGELKTQGILTEAEFQEQKTRILNS